MPTKTFFNLTQEKRDRILKAAEKEFARVPLYKASISNIVKTAKIPRGSFYQYFEDKEDLYGFYFRLILESLQEGLVGAIYKNNGDLFKAIDKYFAFYLDQIVNGQYHSFYRNFFLNITIGNNGKQHGPGFNFQHSERLKELRDQITQATDWKLLKVSGEKDISTLMQLVMMMFFHSVAHYFNDATSNTDPKELFEITLAEFKKNLNWLEFGARKTEEE
ncbi:TetR family transcriptional regulator [Pediococcus claussenii]|uniref:Transcriptional regulator, TetR family n=1 Tax=Pediococcus claussenii (strain ATCC BAA-344 / DSM 14800 / JCM 18046 / KCTC 3811 / LMG 21948 / P06) TaxID=701521 RepID=G8PCF3_PEDCP|nr:TetR family transcriptional regulator [Pediococcus claussenii]AEV94938.1 Transcriptional regulator, TetR family [Pediococcus claussenii ATCC BAA-344]ANZ70130.1 transcriptional regulator [Pediococcus claussenii]ANZ71945.1 transcriptional regulator [Pediococcus claussenii]